MGQNPTIFWGGGKKRPSSTEKGKLRLLQKRKNPMKVLVWSGTKIRTSNGGDQFRRGT